MKHINLGPENKDGLSLYMITQESNSFGDQILSLKQLKRTVRNMLNRYETVYGYEVIDSSLRHEGSWMSQSEMKQWLINTKKGQ
jgi:hypothetical protein